MTSLDREAVTLFLQLILLRHHLIRHFLQLVPELTVRPHFLIQSLVRYRLGSSLQRALILSIHLELEVNIGRLVTS